MADKNELDTITSEIRRYLSNEYGQRLQGIYLFGSHGRGHAAIESDIDIAVVLKERESRFVERQRCSEFISDLSLEYNVVIQLIFLDEREFESQQYALFRNIRNEGIPV